MLIKIENLKKEYRCQHDIIPVFEKLNISINNGDFISIMGKSGCGKSTLLRIVGCLENFDEGRYLLDEQDISALSESQLAVVRNKKIGFVFQNFNLIPEYSVFENIEVPLGYAGVHKKTRKQRVDFLLREMELSDKSRVYPNQLSGGQQQRIAIARALANDPVLLLADEPTGNLDEDNTEKIMNLFKRLNQGGLTIVMVTHDKLAASYANINIDFTDLLTESGEINEKK